MQESDFYTNLIRLVALIVSGKSDNCTANTGSAFSAFLKFYIPDRLHTTYQEMFSDYIAEYKSGGNTKKISSNSVRIIRICNEINAKYNKRTRHLFLLNLIQILFQQNAVDTEIKEYIKLSADSLNISNESFLQIQLFIQGNFNDINNNYCKEVFRGLFCLYLFESDIFLIQKTSGNYFVNEREVETGRTIEFVPGMQISDDNKNVCYFTDVKQQFVIVLPNESKFLIQGISYAYKTRKVLQPVSLSAGQGEFVAILGKSGSGKSTLLRILAGELKPASGRFFITNGSNFIEPSVVIVHQEEFFIPEYSVIELLTERFQLLRASGKINKDADISIINEILIQTGLHDISTQKPGNISNSQLSGGQRKRLSIAMALLQCPQILLVDEPTSGLSSADAREIMKLLRDIANDGKTVICPIHQPSYEYFHYTDKSLILDSGGYPVYFGKTEAAGDYLKLHSGISDARATACSSCNRFEPDELFSIISEKYLDEFGNETAQRKITPEKWYELYLKSLKSFDSFENANHLINEKHSRPRKLLLFVHYLLRDVRRKFKKPLITGSLLLIAIALSVLIGYICRSGDGQYYFGDNQNIPAGFLMMIVTSVFMGMIMSGNEIRGDMIFRKNELKISKSQWLWLLSKLLRMSFVSIVLAIIIVKVTFAFLEIPFDYLKYYILFSLLFFNGACMGLILSLFLKHLSQIYFFAPLLIIPQLILSGVIIDFNNYPTTLRSPKYVPVIAELSVSRWAFEAMAVDAFVNNDYEKLFYKLNYRQHEAAYYLNYFLPQLKNIYGQGNANTEKIMATEWFKNPNLPKLKSNIKTQIDFLEHYFRSRLAEIYSDQQTSFEQLSKVYNLKEIRQRNHNIYIEQIVTASRQTEKYILSENEIIRTYYPIFHLPEDDAGRSHFYAPAKKLGSKYMDTFLFNSIIIGTMNLMLCLLLLLAGTVSITRNKGA